MNDKELLELAAKAAGIDLCWPERWVVVNKNTWGDDDKELRPVAHTVKGGFVDKPWNPLTDDGVALRLAVKLSMGISIPLAYKRTDVVCFNHSALNSVVAHEGDPYAATRRAIVRAAAEIGKGMK